ncbi:MAG TPA: hypothetical protein VG253_20340 [Streptosporangiaceae bacterium]|nr:hypothetical protein [Streptosporangiaceae bacterium]
MLKGAAAGAAGTTVLNAVGYADIAVRARPPSNTPQQVAAELAKRAGLTVPGNDEQRENRLEGLGALAGLATGVAVGAAAGELRFVVLRLGPVLGSLVIGGAAMAVTDLGMAGLGVSDPRTWDATSWLSDALPHLAYGAVTYATLRAMC